VSKHLPKPNAIGHSETTHMKCRSFIKTACAVGAAFAAPKFLSRLETQPAGTNASSFVFPQCNIFMI
jgi:hypothetical protein